MAEVWADNWFALYVNGELVGEDSTPITTERSFNAETITFTATYPLTIGIEAKDFKETDSGLEYIGERNQQMGDGGIIAQITDVGTGKIVAVTNGNWMVMVIHRAPLNPECEKAPDPNTACRFESMEAPPGWAGADFDASRWSPATEWSEAAVRPKDGYNTDPMGRIRPTDLGQRPRNRQHHPPAPDRACSFLIIQPTWEGGTKGTVFFYQFRRTCSFGGFPRDRSDIHQPVLASELSHERDHFRQS